MLHKNVVGIAIAIGSCDSDAFASGAIHEGQLGEVSHAPGAEVSGGHVVFSFYQGWVLLVWRSMDSEQWSVNGGQWSVATKKRRGGNPRLLSSSSLTVSNWKGNCA